MTHSALCSRVMPASPYNYSRGRAGHAITKITPHHVAGILDGTDIHIIDVAHGYNIPRGEVNPRVNAEHLHTAAS